MVDADAFQRQSNEIFLRWACQPKWALKTEALASPSWRAVHVGMIPMHDASFQTVILKSGLTLGQIRAA